MEQKILDLLGQHNYTPLNVAELLTALRLSRNQQKELEQTLASLERAGRIARVKQGSRYALPVDADLIPGRIRMNRQGSGFLQPDDPKAPGVRIPPAAPA